MDVQVFVLFKVDGNANNFLQEDLFVINLFFVVIVFMNLII